VFTRALVRAPTANFGDGLTTVTLGAPDFARASAQHAAYCDALRTCGLTVESLPPHPEYPDATFIEDTAVIVPGLAVLARPGAASRLGEVATVRDAVTHAVGTVREVVSPGTLDGGDVCEHGTHLYIGLSHRTNEEGARQLAVFAAEVGHTASTIDIRGVTSILHLKSGLVSVDDALLVAIEALASHPALKGHDVLQVAPSESYAANCVRVNDRLLVAEGFPRLTTDLRTRGLNPLPLAMSEFQKMDGGLSCLSLRF
jgi:dimethylargininase